MFAFNLLHGGEAWLEEMGGWRKFRTEPKLSGESGEIVGLAAALDSYCHNSNPFWLALMETEVHTIWPFKISPPMLYCLGGTDPQFFLF